MYKAYKTHNKQNTGFCLITNIFQNQPMKANAIRKSTVSYFMLSTNEHVLLRKQPFHIYKKHCRTNIFLRFMSCPLIELIQRGRKEPRKSPLHSFPPIHPKSHFSNEAKFSLVLESHHFKNFS